MNHNITRNVWRYFADYIPYWLGQTGHSGVNSTPADGDAATRTRARQQGNRRARAPTSARACRRQAWEYIINVARSHKWNFVFMTESLDGGAVTYRSARHFDILNENIIFPFQAATTTSDYRGIFDSRRSAYGQGLVLLNSTSHDEAELRRSLSGPRSLWREQHGRRRADDLLRPGERHLRHLRLQPLRE